MKRKLQEKIPEYCNYLYLKTKYFLVSATERLRKKHAERFIKRLLRRFNAQELEHELRRHHRSFAYLLEPSTLFLLGTPTAYFSTVESLNRAWEYCLDNDTPCLQQFYNEVQHAAGNDALHLWLTYLRNRGFCRVHEEMDTIEIFSSSRKYYDNTLGLEDGTTLPIENHPWTYKDELIFGGILKR